MSEEQTHEHHHDRPWFLGHHWENPQQQFEASKLGMWLFLATEVLLFGGLFVGYSVWRGNRPEMFQFGSKYLDTTMGAINTAVLICSSLTMAWAVTAAQQNKQKLLKIMLTLTLAGAVTFLVIKYFEYTHKFNEGIYPGISFYQQPDIEKSHYWDNSTPAFARPTLTIPVANTVPDLTMPMSEMSTVAAGAAGPSGFNVAALEKAEGGEVAPGHDQTPEEATHDAATSEHADVDQPTHHLQDPLRPRDAHMFFNIYFMMTGLHGIHVLLGIFLMSWLLWRAWKGQFSDKYFTPIDLGRLYWHVVDLIWIFLFPLFYLI